LIREVGGIKIYNDTTATTPEATIAALYALSDSRFMNLDSRIILLMGGTDKGLDMTALMAAVREHCKKILLLSGSGTERIRNEFPDALVFDALKPALDAALAASSAGDTILFSPAFASFGMFKNEYDRGDQFMKLVEHIPA